MNIDRLLIYHQLFLKYNQMQLVVAVEELSELQKEICKNLRGKNNIKELTEEIADVQIMLEQLKYFYEIDDVNVENVIEQKLKRTKERLLKK